VFENGNWETKTLGEIGNPKMCKRILKNQTNTTDEIPFYKIGTFGKTPDAFISKEIYDEYRTKYSFPKKGDILISASGTIGRRVRYDGEPAFFQDSNIVWIDNNEKQVLNDYLYVFYEFCDWQPSKGATISRLYNSNLTSIKIVFPKSLEEQKDILKKIDAVSTETKKLETIYQQKINDLDELKKSVLQKAFAGELTASLSSEKSVTKVIPLQKIEGISTTDLQAGITAIALIKHIEKQQHHSFHHVKAEKIIHLAEFILNIDLERNPVKYAAGPNDFTHAKKVESRARKAAFYTVYKNGEHYDYKQGNSINTVIQKTNNCLGEKANLLSQVIDILIPMKTQQAEIVATVYAAWNNLILKGNPFTDEEIVTEARENWHTDKLKIPREKFFNAIEWMRKTESLIPKGNGRIVLTK
jgi:Type I restriction modification DNA specificity domain